jgi:hypothetical protein
VEQFGFLCGAGKVGEGIWKVSIVIREIGSRDSGPVWGTKKRLLPRQKLK